MSLDRVPGPAGDAGAPAAEPVHGDGAGLVGASPVACLVAGMARAVCRMLEEERALADARAAAGGTAATLRIDRRWTALAERREALEAAALASRAASAEGALFQVMLAHGAVLDLVAVELPEEELAAAGEMICRALASVAAFLAEAGAVDPAACGAAFYMPGECTPWQTA